MRISRFAIKENAKLSMRGLKPHVMLVTLVYFIIALVLDGLNIRITGDQTGVFDMMLDGTLGGTSSWSVGIVPGYVSGYGLGGLALVIAIALSLMLYMMQTGFAIYTLRVSRGQPASYGTLFDGFGIIGRVLAVGLLTTLFIFLWLLLAVVPLTIAMVMIMTGYSEYTATIMMSAALLLMIPAMIASYRYRQAIYIMLDNPHMRALDCIRASKRMMSGRKGELFVLDLSFIGWALLTWIPVLNLWILAYMDVTLANYYNELSTGGRIIESEGRVLPPDEPGGPHGGQEPKPPREDPWD